MLPLKQNPRANLHNCKEHSSLRSQ